MVRRGVLNALLTEGFFIYDGLPGMDHHCQSWRSCVWISVFVFWLPCLCLSRANNVWVNHACLLSLNLSSPSRLPLSTLKVQGKMDMSHPYTLTCDINQTLFKGIVSLPKRKLFLQIPQHNFSLCNRQIHRDSWRRMHMDRLLLRFGKKLWEASFSNNIYQGKTTSQPQTEYEDQS